MGSSNTPLVSIIMGSDSDLAIMQDAAKVLDEFQVPYELTVLSAHRTPERCIEYAKSAEGRGLKVIIAAAGGAAHLAGVVAAYTTLPIIGVPIKAKTMDGLDSLLSTIQMPPGIPVATVGINAAKNAGILASQILAVGDTDISNELKKYKERLASDVNAKAEKLEKVKYKQYLDELNKNG